MSGAVAGYTLRQTGYAGLYYVNESPGLWRFWDDTTDGLPPSWVGAMYPTKDTLLADLHSFAAARGYERAA